MSDFSSENSLSLADAPLKDLPTSMNQAVGADNPHEKNRLKRFKTWMTTCNLSSLRILLVINS